MTSENTILTQAILQELLRYDPLTGNLWWRRRARKWFKSDRGWKRWNTIFSNKIAFSSINKGYLVGTIFDKQYLAHRIIWLMIYGKYPKGKTDHKNRVRSDNRLKNLKDVTSIQNGQNANLRCDNTSGIVGVSWKKLENKWQVLIGVNNKYIYLGCFDDFDEACKVRKAAEVEHGFSQNHGRIIF